MIVSSKFGFHIYEISTNFLFPIRSEYGDTLPVPSGWCRLSAGTDQMTGPIWGISSGGLSWERISPLTAAVRVFPACCP